MTQANTALPRDTPLAVSPKDAAHLMGISRTTVHEMLHAGQIAASRVGRRWLIRPEVIEEYLLRGEEQERLVRAATRGSQLRRVK